MGHTALAGFNLGGIVDIKSKNFAFEPGLIFSVKGEADNLKYNDINPFNGGSSFPSKTYLDYIEIPINFVYESNPTNGISLRVGGGPYVAFGISETDIINGNTNSAHILLATQIPMPELGAHRRCEDAKTMDH